MTDDSWLQLTPREHSILDALRSALNANPENSVEVENLAVKVAQGQPHPNITVGVHGGLVQWVLGNPFPIRICDYDGCDLPDLDERGQPCEIWYEPADRWLLVVPSRLVPTARASRTIPP